MNEPMDRAGVVLHARQLVYCIVVEPPCVAQHDRGAVSLHHNTKLIGDMPILPIEHSVMHAPLYLDEEEYKFIALNL